MKRVAFRKIDKRYVAVALSLIMKPTNLNPQKLYTTIWG